MMMYLTGLMKMLGHVFMKDARLCLSEISEKEGLKMKCGEKEDRRED